MDGNEFMAVIPRPPTRDATGEVERPLSALVGEISRQHIQTTRVLKGDAHFRAAYLKPALEMRAVEMTWPGKTAAAISCRLTATVRP